MTSVDSNGSSEIVCMNLSTPHIGRKDIEKIIGMKPRNLELYQVATVHKSLSKEVQNNLAFGYTVLEYYKQTQERLEFLGDAVLNLVVARYLFYKYPNQAEGFLTRIRTKIIKGTNCVNFAKELELGKYIITANNLVRVRDEQGIVINDTILEDTFEAIVGAINEDIGFQYAEAFIIRLIDKCVDFTRIGIDDNYKDIILRYTHSKNYKLPEYNIIESNGPTHNRIFVVNLSITHSPDSMPIVVGTGSGNSKKIAEQAAARNSICNGKKCDIGCIKIHLNELVGIIDRDFILLNHSGLS